MMPNADPKILWDQHLPIIKSFHKEKWVHRYTTAKLMINSPIALIALFGSH